MAYTAVYNQYSKVLQQQYFCKYTHRIFWYGNMTNSSVLKTQITTGKMGFRDAVQGFRFRDTSGFDDMLVQ